MLLPYVLVVATAVVHLTGLPMTRTTTTTAMNLPKSPPLTAKIVRTFFHGICITEEILVCDPTYHQHGNSVIMLGEAAKRSVTKEPENQGEDAKASNGDPKG